MIQFWYRSHNVIKFLRLFNYVYKKKKIEIRSIRRWGSLAFSTREKRF